MKPCGQIYANAKIILTLNTAPILGGIFAAIIFRITHHHSDYKIRVSMENQKELPSVEMDDLSSDPGKIN
jgi:phosphate/sulfate permease